MTKKLEVTRNIPGGWYGNDPGDLPDPNKGNVTVDPRRIAGAVLWLRKRRIKILETKLSGDANAGVMIFYERQGGAR